MFSIDKLNRISLTKGDDAALRVRLYNGNDQINPANGTLEMSVRNYPQGTLLFSIEADNEGYFVIGHSLTTAAEAGFYVYDVQWTNADGDISTVIKSDFNLTDEVTYNAV